MNTTDTIDSLGNLRLTLREVYLAVCARYDSLPARPDTLAERANLMGRIEAYRDSIYHVEQKINELKD